MVDGTASEPAEAAYIISELRRLGITLPALDRAAALWERDPIPMNVVRPSQTDADAQMAAVMGDPAKLEKVVREIAYRNSGAAEQARRLLFRSRDYAVLALLNGAARDIDRALSKELERIRPEVEDAERALPGHGMTAPRLVEFDRDGNGGVARSNVKSGQLREQAAERRRQDGGAALTALDRWGDASARFAALVRVVSRARRAGVLSESAVCLRRSGPTWAPVEQAELIRRAEAQARAAKRSEAEKRRAASEAFSTIPDEEAVYTGQPTPQRKPR